MLTAERFSAAEAYRIGLVHEIVPDEEINSIRPWLKSSRVCSRTARGRWLNARRCCAFAQQPIDAIVIEDAAQRIAQVRSSPEGREGSLAFLEKRKTELDCLKRVEEGNPPRFPENELSPHSPEHRFTLYSEMRA